ncbi:MAG: type II secretion system protein [Lentisphaeria bacterium]|nr:type II secretion system protein [Lentisphaeria bacterium]
MTLFKKNNTLRKKASLFTLIEVVVALAILAIGLSTIFYIFSNSTQNIQQAQKLWANQHLMNNLTEWYLLMGEEERYPNDLLPKGYRGSCQFDLYEDAPEGAPEFIYEGDGKINGWFLGKYTIQLFDDSGNLIQESQVEKIVRDPNE